MQFLAKYAASVGRRAKEERIRVQMWLSEHLRRRHFASDVWSRAVLGQSTILTLSGQTWAMFRLHTLTDGIASRMLARHGISAVWELQVAAAIVYRTGNRTAPECILKMADAAEREWMKAVEMPASII